MSLFLFVYAPTSGVERMLFLNNHNLICKIVVVKSFYFWEEVLIVLNKILIEIILSPIYPPVRDIFKLLKHMS